MPAAVRVSFAVLAIGVALHAAHALSPDAGSGSALDLLSSGVCLVVELGAAALCLARAVSLRGRPAGRWDGSAPWIAIAASIVLWALGDIVWQLLAGERGAAPFPSFADALYVAGYVPLYAGIVLLLRERTRPWTRQRWLDGLIGVLALAALAGELLLSLVAGSAESGLAAVLALAYPLADMTLLCFVVLALIVSRGRDRGEATWAILAIGLVVIAVADAIGSYQQAIGGYAVGTLLNTAWALGPLLLAAAAWRPAPPEPAIDESGASTALPGAFMLLALGLLVIGALDTAPHVGAALLSAGAIGAAAVRAGLVFAENRRLLRKATVESLTDWLTGLPNRRALVADLEACFSECERRPRPRTLAFFDLDGFKAYNDSFGHGAGDELLQRLGAQLAREVAAYGRAYRLGGDEFCVLFKREVDGDSGTMHGAIAALCARGDRFRVTASVGSVVLPREARTAGEALMIADRRMYADKGSGGSRADVRDVLLQALAEREPSLHVHTGGVAALAREVAWRLGARAEELELTVRAAELHDVGKLAIPDAILRKPGPLDDEEWRFMRRHTLIGERIISAAGALRPVARIVRSSHERWDGGGYPDGLAGEEIPLPSRIVLACDAFDAMTTGRDYRPGMAVEKAISRLRSGAGSQFDERVVDTLVEVARERAGERPPAPRASAGAT